MTGRKDFRSELRGGGKTRGTLLAKENEKERGPGKKKNKPRGESHFDLGKN